MHGQQFRRVHTPGAEYMQQSAHGAASGGSVRRVRLADLDPYIHCSVIGTCFASAELREIMVRFAGFDIHRATDFEVHHAALQIAAEGGAGAGALQEALDQRYEADIRHFECARDESELCQLWSAVHPGDETAGAYWALLTHPRATWALRQRVLGELHGLTDVAPHLSPESEGE